MTAHELARKLLEKPDVLVIIRENEAGLQRLTPNVNVIEVLHIKNESARYWGEFCSEDDTFMDPILHEKTTAVILNG